MKYPKSPCLQCEKRSAACHDRCIKYRCYKIALQKWKQAERDEYELTSFIFNTKSALMRKGQKEMYKTGKPR